MKGSSHCSKGFVSAWFLMILLYVCTLTMICSINLSNTMRTMENMEAYNNAFSRHALVIADIRCRLTQQKDEYGNPDFSPYAYNPETRTVTASSGDGTIVIVLNEEQTFIVSCTIIH